MFDEFKWLARFNKKNIIKNYNNENHIELTHNFNKKFVDDIIKKSIYLVYHTSKK